MPNYPKDDFEPPRPSGLIWQAILLVIVLVMLSSVFAQGDESGKMPGIVGEKFGPGRMAGIASAGARLSVYDGDTFTLDGERVRIAAIDTPERSAPQCDAERRLARLARLRLLQLLGDGSAIALERQPLPDRYGRTLARVTVNGVDVSTVLIREGLAVQWEGKRHSWCCGWAQKCPAAHCCTRPGIPLERFRRGSGAGIPSNRARLTLRPCVPRKRR